MQAGRAKCVRPAVSVFLMLDLAHLLGRGPRELALLPATTPHSGQGLGPEFPYHTAGRADGTKILGVRLDGCL